MDNRIREIQIADLSHLNSVCDEYVVRLDHDGDHSRFLALQREHDQRLVEEGEQPDHGGEHPLPGGQHLGAASPERDQQREDEADGAGPRRAHRPVQVADGPERY